MKKTAALLLSLLLLLSCLSACGAKGGNDDQKDGSAARTEAPVLSGGERIRPEDFSVRTADGGEFSLSAALAEGKAVFINLWATWCGWCTVEFPYLQEAYEAYGDRVAVIALSVEPDDTDEAIRAYAAENGLTFPMANAGDGPLNEYAQEGIPVSLLVDRYGNLVYVHTGAIRSAADFTRLFEAYTGEDYRTPATCSYTVYVADTDGGLVPGCEVTFCTDDVCVPVEADAGGVIGYEGAPDEYTVKLIRIPDGYGMTEPSELRTAPYDQTLVFYLQREGA